MHDRQALVVSFLLISGAGIIWHAGNCFCMVQISGHLLVLILFFCFVSRLFAFSSFAFVFLISQSLSCQHQLFPHVQFFHFF
jgi:hypothetical protein